MPGFLRSKWFWIVIVLLALSGCGYAYVHQQQAAQAKAKIAAARPVISPYATISNGKADVEGGVINIAARRAGVVQAVYVQEGDRVKAGQLLAQQENEDARLALADAEAQVAQTRAQIELTQFQIDAARREYKRLERLAPNNFVAVQKLDQAKDTIDQALATLHAQKAAVETAVAAVAQAKYNLDLSAIRAPADGLIVRRYANPGAGASTLNVSNMFDLVPDTRRIVRAEIVESALPNVTVGQTVEMVPESDAAKVYVGTVLRRSAQFGARKLQSDDPSERTDERVVEVVVSADGTPFLIGQRVLVKFLKPGFKPHGAG
jgi:HlyD family secretion protein